MEHVDISELKKLDAMLTEAGIEHKWYDAQILGGAEIKVPNWEEFQSRRGVSVLQFNGAYGAAAGKLECWFRTEKRMDKGPIGWLSAEEAFAMIREAI